MQSLPVAVYNTSVPTDVPLDKNLSIYLNVILALTYFKGMIITTGAFEWRLKQRVVLNEWYYKHHTIVVTKLILQNIITSELRKDNLPIYVFQQKNIVNDSHLHHWASKMHFTSDKYIQMNQKS